MATASTTVEKVDVTKSNSMTVKKQTSVENLSEMTNETCLTTSQTITSVVHTTESKVETEIKESLTESNLKRKVSLDEDILENPKKAKITNDDEFR